MAVGAAGDFVVVWQSNGSGGTDSSSRSVQGQRYASDGSTVGVEFQVNTYTTGVQDGASLALGLGAAADFVVVWESDVSGGTDSSGRSVQGQRYASDGSTVGVEFQVNTYTTNHQRFAVVAVDAVDAEGVFVVLWSSDGSGDTDSSGYSIQGQRYASDGSTAGGEFQVNTYTTGNQATNHFSVSKNYVGDFVVAWHSSGSSGTDSSSRSIQRTPVALIFADGFESGDTSAWSS